MKRFIGILFGLLALVSCKENTCREYENLVLESSLLGADVHYSLVLPADYGRSSAEYPVLCLFHCIGGDCTTGIEYCEITHTLDSLVAIGAIDPMIVVMPDIKMTYCADAFDGSAPYESMVTRELLPMVDSVYRTCGQHFTLGFSMGGFAAMAVALRSPQTFCGYAAMSPSVRTDAQYCSEMPQDGWEDQWGRKFGGMGLEGEGRITDWYRSYCPLHLLEDLPQEQLLGQRHFIVVGDREGRTLAESNPQLHGILQERGIPHHWNVGHGGHDFAYWRSELPSALRFADAAFKGVEYNESASAAGGKAVKRPRVGLARPVDVAGARLYMPTFSYATTRRVPVVFVFGADARQEKHMLSVYRQAYRSGAATPLAFCFAGSDYGKVVLEIADRAMELGIKDGWRMRGAIYLGDSREETLGLPAGQKMFRKAVYAGPEDDVCALFPEWLHAINYKLHD